MNTNHRYIMNYLHHEIIVNSLDVHQTNNSLIINELNIVTNASRRLQGYALLVILKLNY